MSMIVVLRMRGEVGTRKDVRDTFRMLGLKKLYSFSLLEKNPSNIGMVKKVGNFAAWGDASQDTIKSLEGIGARRKTNDAKASVGSASVTGCLKPPKGGFKSKKLRYPKGDLGYNDKLNDIIKRMI